MCDAIGPRGGLILASNGSTSETRIRTPATGHDIAWTKATIVTTIATILPRSSNGLEPIFVTGIA